MSDRKTASTMLTSLRNLISEARLKCDEPNSVPAINHVMIGRPFLRRISKVRGLRMHLISYAIAAEIRRFLKNDTDEGDDGSTASQLTLWPTRLQPFVKEINRARVFVPSRGEFVLLQPKEISKAEVSEAGDYLIAKGEDCIRVGRELVQLSNRM